MNITSKVFKFDQEKIMLLPDAFLSYIVNYQYKEYFEYLSRYIPAYWSYRSWGRINCGAWRQAENACSRMLSWRITLPNGRCRCSIWLICIRFILKAMSWLTHKVRTKMFFLQVCWYINARFTCALGDKHKNDRLYLNIHIFLCCYRPHWNDTGVYSRNWPISGEDQKKNSY